MSLICLFYVKEKISIKFPLKLNSVYFMVSANSCGHDIIRQVMSFVNEMAI